MAGSVVAIVPARFDSSRLPGKALCLIAGKPMVQHVYERSCQAKEVDRVLVATDDARIAEAVRGFGGEVVMTGRHATGTDRVAAVARGIECGIVVNVQGDLPLLQPEMLSKTVKPLLADPLCRMATICVPIRSQEEFANPHVVKVVSDSGGNALYFSRSSIPFLRGFPGGPLGFRHLGIYAYRKTFLLEYAGWSRSWLEEVEDLEQLRALEAGVGIKVSMVDNAGIEVDTADDLERARRFLEREA